MIIIWSNKCKEISHAATGIHGHRGLNCYSSNVQAMSICLSACPSVLSRNLFAQCMKLMVTHIIKKFPTFHETRRFTSVFTRARHCSPL
jgi:hypothetical protein